MEKNDSQLVSQKSLAPILARQKKLLAIEEKILISSEEKIIKNIALEYPDFFVELISNHYPIPLYLLDKYENRWIWYFKHYTNENVTSPFGGKIPLYKNMGLTINSNLLWSLELIEKYKEEWDWDSLSGNPNLPWSIEFISKYKDKWNLSILSQNESIPWSIELIEKLYSNISSIGFGLEWYNLSKNKSLPWSLEFVEKFKDKWHWKLIMSGSYFPCKEEWLIWCPRANAFEVHKTIEAHNSYRNSKHYLWTQEEIDKLGWIIDLSSNKYFPWNIEIIEKYKDRWFWLDLSQNPSLPWSVEFIEKYEDKWDWVYLSENSSILWSIEFIEKHKDKWEEWRRFWPQEKIERIENYKNKSNWFGLNRRLKKIEKEIEEERMRLNTQRNDRFAKSWNGLSKNPSLLWSVEFIEKYHDKWSWSNLSQNPSLPWSIEFINKYKNKLVGWAISENEFLPWSIDLIINFQDKWDFKRLSKLKSIPWSIGLIEKYKNNWDWKELSLNKSVYEKTFKPYLSDDLVDEIMQKIMKKESTK